MDLSSLSGGKAPAQEQRPVFEYTAQAASPIVSGEVKLAISDTALTVAALFDVVEIPFAKMIVLAFADYTVTVKTSDGDYSFSRMGQWAQPFYDALCDAYNKAVLRSLFVKDKPILTADGDFRFTENGTAVYKHAPIHVYENCVVALPPNLSARRVPLCFVTGMDKGDYELTLRLDTGESYTYTKLGYDTAPFADAVEKQIRKLREKALATVKEMAPSLSAAQASQLAKLVPEGAAAPIGQLAAIAPAFVSALEEKLSTTRAAVSYAAFKTMCDPAQIYVGFRRNEAGADGGMSAMLGGLAGGGNPLEALGKLTGISTPQNGTESKVPTPAPYLLWLIAPSPDGKYAAVEFAEADSATFLYNTSGNFDSFAKHLNRALEAISFKREAIRLSDDELLKPENADYLMASDRTAALQFIRANFVDRVIHSSPDAWKHKLMKMWKDGRQ